MSIYNRGILSCVIGDDLISEVSNLIDFFIKTYLDER